MAKIFLLFSLLFLTTPNFAEDQYYPLHDEETLDALVELLLEEEVGFFGSRKNNIHLIDENKESGFALYRTSKPNAQDMREFCRLGITEMLVLSGSADKHEWRFQSACPTLSVLDNLNQKTIRPVETDFLDFFDQWVQEAQEQGRKIAFRCECGCHRTGRLAAYYQMKYQGLTVRQARDVMTQKGKFMWLFPHIYRQVDALGDYVQSGSCNTGRFFCVRG
jgi:hypothetical protein